MAKRLTSLKSLFNVNTLLFTHHFQAKLYSLAVMQPLALVEQIQKNRALKVQPAAGSWGNNLSICMQSMCAQHTSALNIENNPLEETSQ